MLSYTKRLQLLGPQSPYKGFAPVPHWGLPTSTSPNMKSWIRPWAQDWRSPRELPTRMR